MSLLRFCLGFFLISGLAFANEIPRPTNEEAGEALYPHASVMTYIPECASLVERTPRQIQECQAAKAKRRESFKVNLDVCSPAKELPVPEAITCTGTVYSYQQPPRHSVIVFYKVNGVLKAEFFR